MAHEHGLISVGSALNENLPDNISVFFNVDGILRPVLKTIRSLFGLRLVVKMPKCKKKIAVNHNDLLVLSQYNLTGEEASTIMVNCRMACLPIREFFNTTNRIEAYSGIHCG